MSAAWLALGLAIVANVSTNVSLSRAVRGLDATSPGGVILGLLGSPWAWAGGLSGLLLLASFMVAIRTLPLSVSYAAVTTSAMALLLVVGVLSGAESLSLARGAGLALVMAGVALLTLSV